LKDGRKRAIRFALAGTPKSRGNSTIKPKLRGKIGSQIIETDRKGATRHGMLRKGGKKKSGEC